MIRDDRQYRVTQERVVRFRVALAMVERVQPPHADMHMRQAGIDAMRAQLDALERELREYDMRRKESGDDVDVS
jgi:hypothetical protein